MAKTNKQANEAQAENNTPNEATATQPTQPKPEPKVLSDKAQAHRDALKAMRQVKVDYRTKGATIATVQATSPKKAGSKAREVWDLYKPGMTVEDLLKQAEATKGGRSYAQACIVWDVRHGFITLGVAEQPAPAPVAAPA